MGNDLTKQKFHPNHTEENLDEAEFPWRKNLYTIWIAEFIAMVGMSACVPFLPLYIRELGVSDLAEAQRWSGLVQAGPFFLSFLATPLWGALGDKYSRKAMVLRAIIGLTIAMFLMGFAQNVWQLFFLRVFQGAVSGFIAACLSLVSATTPSKHSGYAIGLLQTSISAGMVIGPLFGGVFADAFGVRNVFFIVSALCFISAFVVFIAVREKPRADENKTDQGVFDNIRFVLRQPILMRLMFFIVLTQAGIVFTGPVFAFYVEKLGAPHSILATITGVLVGSVGLLTTIFAPIWGKRNDAYGYERILSLALPFIAVATLAQSFVPTYLWLFPLRAIIGVFSGAMVPTLYAALSKRSPSEIRGGIMGLASSATLFGNLFSPIACGWVAAHWGMEWTFVVASTFLFSVLVAVKLQRSA